MISNNYIPEKINDANAYLDGTRMIGVAASVDLPEVNMKTGTVEGFGVGGEIDSPTIGQWESFEQEVQFNTLYSSAVDMLNPLTVVNLTFRAAQQVYDKTGGYDFKGLRVVEMGRVKKFKPGKIEKSEGINYNLTGTKNKSASRAPAGESIEQRPEEINGREEFGHWEGDTVYSGKGKRKTTRALLTLTERKTRKEIIIAIPNRKAETVVKALDALERKLGARRFRAIFKSITFDNGTEFAAAEELERSCINKHLPRTKVYFCHPYSSWERGTNENTNGMIRRRFPKGTNFAAVTNAQITQAENWINNYPRKILGYKSSEIVFRECLRELGIAA